MKKQIKGRGQLPRNQGGGLPNPQPMGKFLEGPCPHCGGTMHRPTPPNPPLVMSKVYGKLVHEPCAEDARQRGKGKK